MLTLLATYEAKKQQLLVNFVLVILSANICDTLCIDKL